MIIVKNRELLIPNNERYIGTTYDTETENRIFQVPRYSQRGVDLAALTFRLDIQYANESYDTIVLDKEIGEAFVILIWRITSSTLQVPGTMYIGLRAVDNEATVKWSSFSAAMYVERHLNTPGNYGGGLTEIEQMEQDHQYMLSVVNDLKANLDYAHDAEAWAQGTRNGSAVPSSDKTYQKNSKYYSEQANASKNAAANSATAAAGSATQAAATVADTNTRFNNAVAAVTVDTEVQDARVGADGTQYTVLKNRLDAENSLLKSHLAETWKQLNDKNATLDVTYELGYISTQNGSNENNNNYVRSAGYILVMAQYATVSVPNGYHALILLYDANQSYLGYCGWSTGSTDVDISSAKYIRITIGKTTATDISVDLVSGTTIKETFNINRYLSLIKAFGVGLSSNPIAIDTAAKTVSINALILYRNGTNAYASVTDSVSYADAAGNIAIIVYDWNNSDLVAMSYTDYRNADLLRYSTLIAFVTATPVNFASPFNVSVDGVLRGDNSRNYLCTIAPPIRSNASAYAELDTAAQTVTIPGGISLIDDLKAVQYPIQNTVTIDYSSLGTTRKVLIYYDRSSSTFGIHNLQNIAPTNSKWLWVAVICGTDMYINMPYYVNGNLLGQNLQNPANIALGNDPAYADIDSENRTLTFPVGTIIWNPYIRTRYVTLTATNNVCDYSALSGTVFNVYYDYTTNTLKAFEQYLMPNSGMRAIFVGTVKQTNRKVTTSLNCEYRVDGVPPTDKLDGYWKENIDDVINKVALRQTYDNGVCFAFLTDIHWETNWKKSPEIIRYLTDHSRVKLVLCGGDNASGGVSDIDAQKKWLYECTGAFSGNYDYYAVNGNHDNNAIGGSELIGAVELRNLMLPNKYDVHYGNGNYYWFSKDGTTYICLDTGTIGASDATQIAWAKNVIDTTTDDYIVVLMHIIYVSNSDENPCPFFTDLIAAIGTATNKSKVQAIFGGHQHEDHVYTFDGIPVIVTDTDSRFSDDGITRAQNTLTEQCIDVVTINYDTKTINCDRIGAIGTDRAISY